MITGIIAEYNIFHNGHKYQIDEAKKFSDGIVAVMSGSFVQRGDAAITDKWSRAKTALMCGADLVAELPVCYALNAAPNFAQGGINTLNALSVIDAVVFGSECGDIEALKSLSYSMENESCSISDSVKENIAAGMNYPSAVSKAYGGASAELLSKPNNILAVEYLRAIDHTKSPVVPITVKRHLSEHHGDKITGSFASAEAIRRLLHEGKDVSALIPYDFSEIGSSVPFSISRLDSAFAAFLRSTDASYLKNVSEVTEGLENRILRAASEHDTFETIAAGIKSKRYTMSKIRRILIASLIGFTKDIYSPFPEYVRILGMNETGAKILKKAKKNCPVPIITKAADFKESSPQFRLDLRATDISMLCAPKNSLRGGKADFLRSPIIISST